MNILEAIGDQNILRSHFSGESLDSWRAWAVALRCLEGLPIKSQLAKDLVRECTGRDAAELPREGFQSATFIVGRRSGKSRVAAAIAAHASLFGGFEKKLAKGEIASIPVISPSREQSTIIFRGLQSIFTVPLLEREVVDVKEVERQINLRNRIQIKILSNNWMTTRGYTLALVVIDEAAFLQNEEMHIRNDLELIRALKPGLATLNGKLLLITTPYAKKGVVYANYLRQHGANRGVSPSFVERWTHLCWKAASRVMNPTLSQSIVDDAMEEDRAAAMAEYMAEFRDDISGFIDLETVERCVVRGRKELIPHPGISYFGFTDLSGGRGDAAALAIGHNEGRKLIVDCLRSYKPPFNPYQVIQKQADELKRYGIRKVTGDNYSAEFCVQAFKAEGISYTKSEKPASALYLELLPRLCSGEIELLDDEKSVAQIASLERRTRSGGNDVVSHPPNSHDDEANCIAGLAGDNRRKITMGAFSLDQLFATRREPAEA